MYDWVIVGGGIHGTYLARELLDTGVAHDEIAILEQGSRLLHAFRQQARACGMEAMRSNYVHHIGPTPFSLQTYAESRDREDELIPTHNHQPRPTLELFLDHAEYVIDRFDLASLVQKSHVETISEEADALVVETSDGPIEARNVILAIGAGGNYRRPSWASGCAHIEHVWDKDTPPKQRVDAGDDVCIVGGGITAAQFATSVADTAGTVTVYARDGIETALLEADPPWLNWGKIESELHSLPPGSKARQERVTAARNDGTVPPYLAKRLRNARNIRVRTGSVSTVVPTNDRIALSLDSGSDHMLADRVVLATGFETAYRHPLVQSVASAIGLERGYQGMPVLDDDSLRWQRPDGSQPDLFVTGALAMPTLGPFGQNIPGARRSAERITVHTAPSDCILSVGKA